MTGAVSARTGGEGWITNRREGQIIGSSDREGGSVDGSNGCGQSRAIEDCGTVISACGANNNTDDSQKDEEKEGHG